MTLKSIEDMPVFEDQKSLPLKKVEMPELSRDK
jgi:hypothetical protein